MCYVSLLTKSPIAGDKNAHNGGDAVCSLLVSSTSLQFPHCCESTDQFVRSFHFFGVYNHDYFWTHWLCIFKNHVITRYPYINIVWFCCNFLAMSNSCQNPFILALCNVCILFWFLTMKTRRQKINSYCIALTETFLGSNSRKNRWLAKAEPVYWTSAWL